MGEPMDRKKTQEMRLDPTPDSYPTDVLLITATKEEYDQVLAVEDGALGAWSEQNLDGFTVSFRRYRMINTGTLSVALTWTPRMRTTSTADTTGRLIGAVKPRCLAMCGVCAGRIGKVHLGDVIIGSLLYSYDAGALVVEYDEKGGRHERFKADPDPRALDEAWLHQAQGFQMPVLLPRPPTLKEQEDWLRWQLGAKKNPLQDVERQKRCPAWPQTLTRLREYGHLEESSPLKLTKAGEEYIQHLQDDNPDGLPAMPAPRVHVAPIATGSNVIRDERLFDRLSDSMREVLGVDMEAAAIGAIGHARKLPWIVMKGVMDHADLDKDDAIKPFAARAAAECLIAFLRQNLALAATFRRQNQLLLRPIAAWWGLLILATFIAIAGSAWHLQHTHYVTFYSSSYNPSLIGVKLYYDCKKDGRPPPIQIAPKDSVRNEIKLYPGVMYKLPLGDILHLSQVCDGKLWQNEISREKLMTWFGLISLSRDPY